MKYCKDCKYFLPSVASNWWLLLPVAGWMMWILTRIDADKLRFGKCAVCPRSGNYTGARNLFMFADHAREWGACGKDAKLFEPK